MLVDAYASMAVRAQSLDFGRLRVWGSIGVVVSTALAGWAIGRTGIETLPLLVAALLLVPTVATVLPSDRRLASAELPSRRGRRVLAADRALIGAMLSASFVMGSHGVVNSFGAIRWSAAGLPATQIGLLNATAVASEIVAFTLSGLLLGPRDPRWLIALAAIVAAVRRAIMADHEPNAPARVPGKPWRRR